MIDVSKNYFNIDNRHFVFIYNKNYGLSLTFYEVDTYDPNKHCIITDKKVFWEIYYNVSQNKYYNLTKGSNTVIEYLRLLILFSEFKVPVELTTEFFNRVYRDNEFYTKISALQEA